MNTRPTIGLVVYPQGGRWVVANSRNPPHPILTFVELADALGHVGYLAAQGLTMGYDVTIHASPVASATT